MHESSPLLIAFVTEPPLERVLERAMRGGRLLLAGSPREFVNLAGREEPNGILVDVSVSQLEIEALVPAAVASLPRVPVLLYTPLDPRRAGDVLRIAQCFPTSVVLQGYDDVARGICRFLRDELGVTAATALVSDLAEAVRVEAQWIVRYCLARTTTPPTVNELSSIAGMSVRTLNRHVGGACGMSPRALMTRTRLLFAAAILHVSRLSIAQAAEAAGFADASSLSHSMAEHFGWRCGELRERGSFPSLVRSLRTRYPRWLAYESDAM